jgi:hypothetical protein
MRLRAALVAVVIALATMATTLATQARAGQPQAETWIVNQRTILLLGQVGLDQKQAEQLFGGKDTFLLVSQRPGGSPRPGDHVHPGGAGLGNAARTVSFTSYAALRTALTVGALPPGTRAVLYDNEHWPLTPVGEQQNPAKYEALAASLAHAHHLLFISTPAVTLTDVLAPKAANRYAAYLKLGLVTSAARYADAVDIQAQGTEANLTAYVAFVRAAVAQARAANRHVLVFAGISTNPDGQRVTSAQFTAAVDAVRRYINGFWLNIPGGGPACPSCGTPQPQIALPLLRSLL